MQDESKFFAVIPAGSLNLLMRIIGLMFVAMTTFATTTHEDGNDVEWQRQLDRGIPTATATAERNAAAARSSVVIDS